MPSRSDRSCRRIEIGVRVGVVALGVLASAGSVSGQTDASFTGGGATDHWTDPANWDTAQFPTENNPAGASYDVLIASGFQVDLNDDITIEDLILAPGSLGIVLDDASPLHTNTLKINGLFTWSDGSLNGRGIGSGQFNTGDMIVEAGVNLNNVDPVSFSRWSIHNIGHTVLTGSNVNFGIGALFDNNPTGVVEFQNDADFKRFQDSTLTNAGLIVKSAGTGVTEIAPTILQDASGTIEARTGTLDLGPGSYAGQLKATGGHIDIGFVSPVSFDSTSFTVTDGGTIDIHADADYVGTFTSTGDGSGVVDIRGTMNIATDETVELDFSAHAPVSFWDTTGDGTLINKGHAIWATNTIGGGLVNKGQLEIGGFSSAHILAANQTLENDVTGVVTHLAQVALSLGANATVVNHGVWDIQVDHTQVFDHEMGASFTNSATGLLMKGAGAGLTWARDLPISSAGTILASSGTLRIGNAGHISGHLSASAGALDLAGPDMVLDNVSFDVNSGGTVSTFQVAGNSTRLIGAFTSTGDGSGEVRLGGALSVANGDSVIFNLQTDGSTMGAPLVLNGSLDGPGEAQNVGDMIQDVGGRILMGDGTAAGGGFVNAAGGSYLIKGGSLGSSGGDDGTFINRGTVAMTGALFVNGDSRIINQAADMTPVTWTLDGDGADIIFSNSAVFENHGELRRTGAGSSTINPRVVNAGLVDVQAGSLFISQYTQNSGTLRLSGGTFSADFGGSMTFQGGFIEGDGVLDGHVQHVAGFLEPGDDGGLGRIDITDGQYNQGDDALLRIDIAGLIPQAEHDLLTVGLVVGYSANLGGTIQVLFDAGYTPHLGDWWDVLLVGGLINDQGFDLSARGLDPGLTLQSSIVTLTDPTVTLLSDYQALRLTVIPEPTSLALLAGGAMLGLARRRRGGRGGEGAPRAVGRIRRAAAPR